MTKYDQIQTQLLHLVTQQRIDTFEHKKRETLKISLFIISIVNLVTLYFLTCRIADFKCLCLTQSLLNFSYNSHRCIKVSLN